MAGQPDGQPVYPADIGGIDFMGFETFTKGMQDANEVLNRNFAAVETQLNGMSIQLYVSINGSDESGDGTQDKPYRTI